MIPILLGAFDTTIAAFRIVLLASAAVLTAVCTLDWMVRTRRLSPFGPVARFMRSSVDPLLKPLERRVVRSGGLPSSAPWWALATVVVAGIVLLSLLAFLRSQVAFLYLSLTSGPAGIIRLLITWAFAVAQVALIVRVLHSWFPVRPGAWWWRWSYAITEPMLKPLRRVIPMIAMIDITPIIAWFGLVIVQGILIR
ncbi:MAG: YggT family protein, partial [Gemmatimonadales bacterium]